MRKDSNTYLTDKESLKGYGQQFIQYPQTYQQPLTSNH
jgi:hypothetical protein